MGRRTVADTKTVEGHAAALRASGVRFQTGLLIGSSDDTRTVIVHLAPTPPTEQTPSFETLKTSWIVEHWRQVARMLPGGLSVVGLYAFAPLDESEQHVMQLNTALRSASKKVIPGVVGHRELTLLRICANSKQYVTKTVTAVPKAEEKPADLVFENILPSITVARATFVLQHTLLVSDDKQPLSTHVHNGLAPLYDEIAAAVAVPDKDNNYKFYMPLSLEGEERSTVRDGVGRVSVALAVSACAVLLTRGAQPVQIEKALKEDIVRSIATRFSVLCEELDRVGGDANPFGGKTQALAQTWPLPVRALIAASSSLWFTDYIVPGEGKKEVHERAKDMLSLDAPLVSGVVIEEPLSTMALTVGASVPSPAAPAQSKTDAAKASSTGAQATRTASASSSAPLLLAGAVLVVVLALLAAVLLKPSVASAPAR